MAKKNNTKNQEPIELQPITKEAVKPAQSQQTFMGMMAEEIAKTVVERLPKMLTLPKKRKSKSKQKKIENPIFLDTSAIIDARIFDVINLGVFTGTFVVPESV